jgi:hypothetical protein
MKVVSKIAWILSVTLPLALAAWMIYIAIRGRMSVPPIEHYFYLSLALASGLLLLFRISPGRFLAAGLFLSILAQMASNGPYTSAEIMQIIVIAPILAGLTLLNIFGKAYRANLR